VPWQQLVFNLVPNAIETMDPEKIFSAFFTTKENSMGMSLAICRCIIDAHPRRLFRALLDQHE